ncbi:hypothetical protein RSOLAG1IB_09775 [Rhizoctonia solani AG-1 IB]|uniref:Uncharacterized protein n=1 Tax=Thanatephorus cucumeris (strain AG1-IB / isolate 7/3/14) TaxID=1108050 RepID=A0A0B7FW95_THACB|nr:hypothetical protein RSOLAG1IB_09775 [Rhizoctonia solani AG-1 IB]
MEVTNVTLQVVVTGRHVSSQLYNNQPRNLSLLYLPILSNDFWDASDVHIVILKRSDSRRTSAQPCRKFVWYRLDSTSQSLCPSQTFQLTPSSHSHTTRHLSFRPKSRYFDYLAPSL